MRCSPMFMILILANCTVAGPVLPDESDESDKRLGMAATFLGICKLVSDLSELEHQTVCALTGEERVTAIANIRSATDADAEAARQSLRDRLAGTPNLSSCVRQSQIYECRSQYVLEWMGCINALQTNTSTRSLAECCSIAGQFPPPTWCVGAERRPVPDSLSGVNSCSSIRELDQTDLTSLCQWAASSAMVSAETCERLTRKVGAICWTGVDPDGEFAYRYDASQTSPSHIDVNVAEWESCITALAMQSDDLLASPARQPPQCVFGCMPELQGARQADILVCE